MRILGNMSLIMWDQIVDPYDHVQLANNMAKLDAHDHTPGRGVRLTTQSIEGEAITNSLLATNSVTSAKIENETIALADLSTGLQNKVFTSRKAISIATEESRENTAYGLLPTPDEVEVTLGANGLIVIGYQANWESSVGNAGKAAIFLGANQLKDRDAELQEATSIDTALHAMSTSTSGLVGAAAAAGTQVTTGQVLGQGVVRVFAAAGTYKVGVRFKATSGKVKVKERKLWVEVKSFAE